MRLPNTVKPNRVGAAALTFVLLFSILSVSIARADTVTKPYFKTFGADVLVGGAFSQDVTNSNCTTNYQYATGADPNAGGIFAFAKDNSGKANGGSSSQYGALALGDIQGNAGAGTGFYSGGAQAGTVSHNYTTFANTSGTSWGGSFEGTVPQSSCIPDYYDLKQSNPQTCCTTTPFGDSIDLNNANGQYIMNPGTGNAVINPVGADIPVGRKITVFVNGNAYISNNIKYQPGSTESNVTKFALIVKGSIFIDPSVSQLDGIYIAQPRTNDPSADDGNIWTCHGSTSDQVLYSYPAFISACANKLTINGALIAKQVNFTRINGNVSGSSTAEDNLSNAQGSGNIAEVINYTPEMIMGGAFFNPSTVTNYKVESLISLPPVF